MTTLLEFCEQFKISMRKAKRMHKAGVLRIAETLDPDLDRVRQNLASYNPLSALDLCYLAENPGALLELGKFVYKAQDQMSDIGDAIKEAASSEVAAIVGDAATGDPAALESLARWIRGALPENGAPVSHTWLACRLLLALPKSVRQYEAPRIIRAFARVRKLGHFSDWFRYEAQSGRKATVYARPKNLLGISDL